MHPLLIEVFRQWNDCALRWALLRLPAHPAAPAGDVDLLVHPDDLTAVQQSLKDHCFTALPHIGYGQDCFYLSYHEPSGHWLWLHVTSAITFGPCQMYRTDVAVPCLDRRGEIPPLFLLDPHDTFWLLVLHCLLDKRRIEDHHRARLCDLAFQVRGESPLLPVVTELIPPGCAADTIVEWTRSGRWEEVEALAPGLIDRFRHRCPTPRRRLAARYAGRWLTLLLNISRPVLWRRYFHRRRTRSQSSAMSESVP